MDYFCVVFDMDGVLFDSERIYARAWREAGQTFGLADLEASINACIGRNSTDIRAVIANKYGPALPVDDFIAEIRAAFKKIADAEGLPLKPGVFELLDWLKGTNAKLALATSTGEKTAVEKLSAAGLLPYFTVLVTGDMVLHGKPAPDIYRLACEKLGVPPDICYAVEDSPNGVLSAHAAGLKTLLVPDVITPTAEIFSLAFKTFPSLFDVKAFFEGLR
ncbi:HAD family phosphatase [Oscillospiraceae bacterium WX1]